MLESLSKLEDFSLRELDVLVAKFFYKLETKIERVDSNNSNTLRYLVYRKTKKARFRGYSKVKSNVEKLDKHWKPLPRYSVDIRDFYKFAQDFTGKYRCKLSITLLDNNTSIVVISGQPLTGKLCDVGVKLMLAYILEKENQ